ncbi:murein L,D-transpeptidase [Flavobacterium sp. GT3R68]|uniref:L,D-transpeptidase family protein n=1 Tax=Flavobacterium sp. GT3R68 TaxID=2594437 RepID=UPI000F86751C|nr:L,D-transpeptidase family protein [Flavobacterium sp. GT3R68]RTY87535.1 peptidoglycan-binding protein [Flavobacterium sp. GSN2]TRW90446.1 L,D-transpeptidase family protein [Flavobacterium sp. GT3R68]
MIKLLLIMVCFFSLTPKEFQTPQGYLLSIANNHVLADTTKTPKYVIKKSTKNTQWTVDQRKLLITVLAKSDEEGLNPKNYQIEKLEKYEMMDSISETDILKYNLLLSGNLKKYISHLTNGKLNPRKLYADWDLKENRIEIDTIMLRLETGDSLAQKLETLKPQHSIYKKLKKALQIINTYPDDPFKKINIAKSIVPNSDNRLLINIKKRLIYWHDLEASDSLTTFYDSLTVNAVKKFQWRHGLVVDGIIGMGTIASLNYTKEDRKQQIIANLERWKWYPRDMGSEYIIINIPDFRLTLVKGSDTIRSHKAIVGRAERATPILSSTLTHAVFNPTWTVPPTILREDVIPEILKSRSYLAEMNIIIYDEKGNVVSPENWQLSQAKNYRYVQTPGAFNSLGMVKLIFPNRFAVYLHDTNHRDYFEKTGRSLSSGCVRVNNPLELTEYLLDDPVNWNLEKITTTLQKAQTIQAPIRKEVNIHILYWTAWCQDDTLIFRDDIYNLDADLYNKL